MATKIKDHAGSDVGDDLVAIESLVAEIEQSERSRKAALRRLTGVAKEARAGSVRSRQLLPDLFA